MMLMHMSDDDDDICADSDHNVRCRFFLKRIRNLISFIVHAFSVVNGCAIELPLLYSISLAS